MTPSMHLDEERLQRHLHGELTPAEASAVRGHLESCNQCRTRLAEAEREQQEVYALLREVDHPPPRVDANALLVAAKAGPQTPGWGRWAAGILLTTGFVAAAYAAPGSPLRSWLQNLTDRSEPVRPVAPDARPESGRAGVVVTPTSDFEIVFSAEQTAGHALVTLTEETDVTIRAAGGTATFTSDEKRLLVNNSGSTGVFEIDIPRSARRIEIRVAGVRVWLKQGDQISSSNPAESDGRYRLSLNP